MSTETTNKKIKIDNGTTFGRTYTDKAVDELLKTISNKIWYELDTMSGTITQNQYNEIKALIDSNSLAGIKQTTQYNYYPLFMSLNGIFVFGDYALGSVSTDNDSKNALDDSIITIKPDLSIASSSTRIFFPVLTQNLSSQSILSIKTDGYQQNLTIGDGLKIENGALKTTSNVLEVSVTDILTSQDKILTIFSAMSSNPTSRTHTAISLDNSIPLSEFQNCDKIILDLSSLSSLGISGQLVFTKGFNTSSHGRAFYLTYMVGGVTSFSIANVVLATDSDGTALIRLVVEQSGTATPLIDTDLANYYTKTEVDSAIQSTIGDINSILDNINGEVI